MSKIQLYHYTNDSGANGIKKDRMIKGSTDAVPKKNRRFGKGVYFTSIDPNNDPKSILLNNYDDAGRVVNSRRLWDRLEWVVEVYIPEDEVEKVAETNRDVYLYAGDVNLSLYQYEIYKNPRI